MPIAKEEGGKKPRKLRKFPPSLAGSCLRYQVMDVLGFGRLIDPDSQAAMRAGSALHQVFQAELREAYAMCRVEVKIGDNQWGVSGRMDALLDTSWGQWVVEYKTVSPQRFEKVLEGGPLLTHWAQLQLYMMLGDLAKGSLVVEERPTGRRLIFHADLDPLWSDWLKDRIGRVKTYQLSRELPEREVSGECLSCDRWQRCFRDESDRAQRVWTHPVWEPEPGVPSRWAFVPSKDIVS